MSSRKQQLQQRLREKLAAQKMGRSSKLVLKKQKETCTDIYHCTELLMRDTAILSARGVKNPVQRAKMLKKQHSWLSENHFAIFKATVYGEMQLGMLRMMLDEKKSIDSNQSSAKQASLRVGDVLAKKYNVDVEKLEKHALKIMKEQGVEIPEEYKQ